MVLDELDEGPRTKMFLARESRFPRYDQNGWHMSSCICYALENSPNLARSFRGQKHASQIQNQRSSSRVFLSNVKGIIRSWRFMKLYNYRAYPCITVPPKTVWPSHHSQATLTACQKLAHVQVPRVSLSLALHLLRKNQPYLQKATYARFGNIKAETNNYTIKLYNQQSHCPLKRLL